MQTMTFTRIGSTPLSVATDGDGKDRVLVFRKITANQDLIRIPGTNIILIGGNETLTELKNLLKEHGRKTLNDLIPGGISGSTHTKLRAHLNITEHSEFTPTRYTAN